MPQFIVDFRKTLQTRSTQVYQSIGLAYYYLFAGPRGRGWRRSDASWNKQYTSGYWDFFDTIDEMPRYAIVAAYIRRFKGPTSVLDVGCGYGQLVRELDSSFVGRYLGIDLSAGAIERARLRPHANAAFVVADVETWPGDEGRYDIIVFNEVLYYLDDPVETLRHYQAFLNPGGIIIVVMFRHRNTMVIWKNIARRFATVDPIEVRNAKRELTDIRIVVPRRRAATSRA